MLPWVYGSSGPAPEALRCEDDDGVLNTAADHDVMSSVVGADCQHQQQQVSAPRTRYLSLRRVARAFIYDCVKGGLMDPCPSVDQRETWVNVPPSRGEKYEQ